MTLGFVVSDLAAPEVNGSRLRLHRTEPLAAWAGLLSSQEGCLLLQKFFNRPFGYSTSRSRGRLLDIVGVEVQLWTDLFVDTSRDDFPPSLGHPLYPRPIHRR